MKMIAIVANDSVCSIDMNKITWLKSHKMAMMKNELSEKVELLASFGLTNTNRETGNCQLEQ